MEIKVCFCNSCDRKTEFEFRNDCGPEGYYCIYCLSMLQSEDEDKDNAAESVIKNSKLVKEFESVGYQLITKDNDDPQPYNSSDSSYPEGFYVAMTQLSIILKIKRLSDGKIMALKISTESEDEEEADGKSSNADKLKRESDMMKRCGSRNMAGGTVEAVPHIYTPEIPDGAKGYKYEQLKKGKFLLMDFIVGSDVEEKYFVEKVLGEEIDEGKRGYILDFTDRQISEFFKNLHDFSVQMFKALVELKTVDGYNDQKDYGVGVVHKDIKPGNIHVGTIENIASRYYLMDFNLARFRVNNLGRSLTGTASYREAFVLDENIYEDYQMGGYNFEFDMLGLCRTLFSYILNVKPAHVVDRKRAFDEFFNGYDETALQESTMVKEGRRYRIADDCRDIVNTVINERQEEKFIFDAVWDRVQNNAGISENDRVKYLSLLDVIYRGMDYNEANRYKAEEALYLINGSFAFCPNCGTPLHRNATSCPSHTCNMGLHSLRFDNTGFAYGESKDNTKNNTYNFAALPSVYPHTNERSSLVFNTRRQLTNDGYSIVTLLNFGKADRKFPPVIINDCLYVYLQRENKYYIGGWYLGDAYMPLNAVAIEGIPQRPLLYAEGKIFAVTDAGFSFFNIDKYGSPVKNAVKASYNLSARNNKNVRIKSVMSAPVGVGNRIYFIAKIEPSAQNTKDFVLAQMVCDDSYGIEWTAVDFFTKPLKKPCVISDSAKTESKSYNNLDYYSVVVPCAEGDVKNPTYKLKFYSFNKGSDEAEIFEVRTLPNVDMRSFNGKLYVFKKSSIKADFTDLCNVYSADGREVIYNYGGRAGEMRVGGTSWLLPMPVFTELGIIANTRGGVQLFEWVRGTENIYFMNNGRPVDTYCLSSKDRDNVGNIVAFNNGCFVFAEGEYFKEALLYKDKVIRFNTKKIEVTESK